MSDIHSCTTKPMPLYAAPVAAEPVGYLPAYELDRLKSGHDAKLRSARFGPSHLDGDIAVYAAPVQPAEPAIPEGMVLVPRSTIDRVQAALGAFLMDEGWTQEHMDASDDLAHFAAAPAAPAQGGSDD